MPPLSADRWRTLSPFLDEALEIANGERAGWRPIRARDPVLAADLQLLLAEHDALDESRFLEGAVPLAPGTAPRRRSRDRSSAPTGWSHSSVRAEWAASGWPNGATAASKDARRSNY